MPQNVNRLRNGMLIKHGGETYVVGSQSSLIKMPKNARTTRQRMLYLLKRGYVWTAYMFAKHADKVLLRLLQTAHPNVPWKNIDFAARPNAHLPRR